MRVWTGVEPYNYAPYMGLSTQFIGQIPHHSPHLPEVGLTIDRCIISTVSDGHNLLGTTFSNMQRLNAHLHTKKTPPYIINLDPAVLQVPFPANIGK